MNTKTSSYPLSSTQLDIWLDQMLQPEIPLYNIGGYLQITGPIDRQILELAINQVIQENDALRLKFFLDQDQLPRQQIQQSPPFSLEYEDFSHQDDPHQSALDKMQQGIAQPFILLSHHPLFHFALYKISTSNYYLFNCYHHLIVDGWAISLLLQRVAAAYNAIITKQPLSSPQYSYLDFLEQDQNYRHCAKWQQDRDYWQTKYQTPPATLIPRRYAAKFVGQAIPSQLSCLTLPRPFYNQLITLAQSLDTTIFHLILAVFYCYFVRIYNRQELVIGLSILNRNSAAFKNTIGLFISVSPTRLSFGTRLNFIKLLQAIGKELRQEYRHQRFPLGEINKLFPSSHTGQQLFDITLSYEKHNYTTYFDGCLTQAIALRNGFERNALALFIREFHDTEDVRIDFDYNLSAFQPDEIELFKNRIFFLLDNLSQHITQPIRAIPLLPEAERQKLLIEFNQTATTLPPYQTIVALFEAQVKKTPTNIAIIYKLKHLTYQALNTRANRLAHHLRNQGVKPEVIVGICLERSFDLVVGLLAILKAGGAYLPLDPTYPKARLAFMLADAQASVILTQQKWLAELPTSRTNTVCLDRDSKAISRCSPNNPVSRVQANHLAYMIYTSGSTGKPKGVEITHRNLVSLTHTLIPVFKMQTGVRLLQFASLNFDVATSDFTFTLCSGATLVMIPSTEALLSDHGLIHALYKKEITHLQIPPSVLGKLPHLKTLTSLHTIIVAGETCSANLVAHWSKGRSFFNAYGPTETTIYATLTQCFDENSQINPPIGWPLANTQIYILDRFLQPLPIGVAGELHIGGIGLARGYRQRAKLTAEKFIPHPFSQQPGARLYKTGDLARYLPDGNIEYLERLDRQVKIRGFRIELGEVETLLNQHNEIQQALVMAREDVPGHYRMVVYFISKTAVFDRIAFNHLQEDNETLLEIADRSLMVTNYDISKGGLGIKFSNLQPLLPIKHPVRFKMRCPFTDQTHWLQGKIIWCRYEQNYIRAGIQFGKLSSADQAFIAKMRKVVLDHGYFYFWQRLLAGQLREYLAKKVPAYMLPGAYVLLESFPLTPNGKIDRQALPPPNTTASSLKDPFITVLTPNQQLIKEIWEELLGVTQISIYDNFFELGGHSLLATQVISRLQTVFERQIPLKTLFENPTIAQFNQACQTILIEQAQTMITPIDRSHPLPLSFAQQRLWFIDQFEGGRLATYNAPNILRLTGTLEITAFTQSLATIIERHESLRTLITEIDGQPQQVIQTINECKTELPVIDLQTLPSDKQTIESQRLILADSRRPFDLSHDPLFRILLIQLAAQDYYFLLTLHHINSDGWSMGVLVQELKTLYQAYLDGHPSPLPPLTIQYADFAHWQRQQLTEDHLQKQLKYWQQQLADIPPLLVLPNDRHRPAVQTFRGQRIYFQLPSELTEQLKIYSQQHDVTLFMTLLAAFATLLHRYSEQEEIVIGTPIANRNNNQIEELIGFFINMLALRCQFKSDVLFTQLLTQVRETCLQAYAHQDVPFEQVIEALKPKRSLSYTPIFQVVFVLQNAPMTQLALPQLTVQIVEPDNLTAKYDLVFSLTETLSGHVEYATDLFDAATIQRMIGHFQTLLTGIVTLEQPHLSQLPLLTQTEYQQLMDWNRTQADYPSDQCIHHLFEAQVAKTPDAIALVFEEQQLTYQTLNHKANQVAHFLLKVGVQPDTLVGLCIARSLEMVIGILGILKAGGAFVTLDPHAPLSRLSFMFEDLQLSVLLTMTQWLDLLPANKNIHRIYLDDSHIWSNDQTMAGQNPLTKVKPSHLAYLIYTSGSTGKPKGVLTNHQGLVNLAWWHKNTFQLNQSDKATQLATITFDASIWEIWPYLVVGASVYLVNSELLDLPSTLQQWLIAKKITRTFIPTPLAEKILALPWPSSSCLQTLLTGGDKLNEFPSTSLPFRLFNNYGPTESTVVTTSGEVLSHQQPVSSPLLGHPIANTQVYILDRHFNLVPIGIPGELSISGVGLARGYLNRPALTKEKFITNPFQAKFQDNPDFARLYQTGDLARYLPDGKIEYLGRIDNQVKIRGFRIELGEIEVVLTQHPLVQKAVVNIWQEQHEGLQNETVLDKMLVAYMVLDPSHQATQIQQSSPAESTEYISQWQVIFDEVYGCANLEPPTFNINGWNDSYTRRPMATTHMREWVNSTVARILAYQPQQVLEIGCGTGLLLFKMAPHCQTYYGTDISAEALQYIEKHQPKMPATLSLKLIQQPAHQFEELINQQFDTVILNSVVQYFPSLDYLLTVLTGALKLVKPGGIIFLGDVRSFPLLEAFHASVQFYQAPNSLSRTSLTQKIHSQINKEKELVIDPAFFLAFQQQWPQITRVQIQLKRGHYLNEMTKFRYDVTLYIDSDHQGEPALELDWSSDSLTLPALEQYLFTEQPSTLLVKAIPNARISADFKLLALLRADSAPKTVAKLRRQLPASSTGIDPETLWQLAEQQGYQVEIMPAIENPANYHAVFYQAKAGHFQCPTIQVFEHQPWSHYANHPYQQTSHKDLTPQLRAYLKEYLPDYMIPVTFITVSALPLTASGKVDRQALPAPHAYRQSTNTTLVAPRNPIEEELVTLWAEVLGIEHFGINDDFFELGGHSLLATQIVSRIRNTFEVEIPLRQLFETTTIANLAKRIENTRQQIQRPPIQPVTREQPLALSFAQQRLWFIDQFEGGNNALYNMPAALQLSGYLNLIALEQTLEEIVCRHEILRTRFPHQNGIPYQSIQPTSTVSDLLAVIDLTLLTDEQQQIETQRLINQEAMQPFDLASGPLFRATLLQLSTTEQVLLLTMHHIISDGWSMGVLVKELNLLYEAFSQQRPSPLSPLPIQYADYANWQRQWLTGDVLDNQLAYWQQQLAAAPALLELPTDRPRPALQTFRGHTIYFEIASTLVESLKILSRQNKTTLFMTLHATFITLLARYSGQEHIVVGSPIANRTQSEIESLIGFFVNTLVLHTDLSGNPTFQQLLSRVRQETLNAYLHQDLPFEQLVDVLKPPRNLGYSPLFQVMLVFQNMPLEELDLAGLTATFLSPTNKIARFDLTLSLTEKNEQLEGYLEYNTDLFDASTIQRMIGHFQVLLAGIVDHPQQRINELPLLTVAEQQQCLAWNQTQTEYPKDRCVHQLFEAQVAKTPNAIAVVFEEQQLTYQALNEQANQLAHYLRTLGVQPEVLVGLCVERSLAMIIGILGILKAGGAYLPLDPTYPSARIAFMLADAQVTVLLTHSRTQQNLPSHHGKVINLDADWKTFSTLSKNNLNVEVTANNIAYVDYTSGSTGQPKGVEIPHRGITRLLFGVDYVQLDANQVFLQMAPISFDASTLEIWGALLHGGQCVLFPNQTPTTQELNRVLHQFHINTLWLTAALFNTIIDESPEILSDIRQLLVGGEALSTTHIRRALNALPNTQLINGYGPTESTTFTCCYPIPQSLFLSAQGLFTIPIGKPISNTKVYLLDSSLNLVPIGVLGELYIGGDGLARAYLNRPTLTAEKFIPNPFSQQPGARLYKTGDLARYLPDGQIEYLGRIDHQVKIRGFRIELGEIESLLAQHESVQEVVVMAREDHPGDKRLVAYLVPKLSIERLSYHTDCLCEFKGQSFSSLTQDFSAYGLFLNSGTADFNLDTQVQPKQEKTVTVTLTLPGESQACQLHGHVHQQGPDQCSVSFSPTSPDGQRLHQAFLYLLTQRNYLSDFQRQTGELLQRTLKEQLPAYMIPSTFVVLPALPLTPNGKIDRQALPAPQNQRLSDNNYVAPRTPTEQLLADLWADILGLTPIGIHDNFFELGGDSILSIQLISQANQQGLSLTPKQLFSYQTIAELASVLTEAPLVQSPTQLRGKIPLTPIQRWFFALELPQAHHFNQAVLLTLPGSHHLKLDLLEASLQALINHHDELRACFVREGMQWQSTILPTEDLNTPWFSMVDLSDQSEKPWVLAPDWFDRLQGSLDLAVGPLMKVVFLDWGHEGRLLWIIHHLVIDAVSWRILLADLAQAYEQLSSGKPIDLPPKTTSIKTYSQKLLEYAHSETLAQELTFWQSQVTDTRLPLDHEPPITENLVATTRVVQMSLSTTLTQALLHEVPSAYNTQINDALLTALLQAFGGWTGQPHLWVLMEGHGRDLWFEEFNLTRTVGWFTSIYPVLLIAENKLAQPGELLKAVKEQLHAVPHHGIGYGILRYLRHHIDLQNLPMPQVSFNYLGQLDQTALAGSTGALNFQLATEDAGAIQSPSNQRAQLIEINGFILNGRLQMDWHYNQQFHQETTIKTLAQDFMTALETLITHCQSVETKEYTPSDFPDTELNQEELDDLFDDLNEF
jgi:amino acid adenylation domain-containing protein/non-ribosomal peptide synthase protein (TIGR01720 family)